MKKVISVLFVAMICTTISFSSKASSNSIDEKQQVSLMTNEQKQERLDEISARVQEIKNMDKTSLTKDDKAELKTELKQMNKETRIIRRGGVFISVGGLIIIILLLIILL